MKVDCILEKDLTARTAAEIQELQHLAFPKTVEFATQRWWHEPLSPDELWFMARLDGKLSGSVRVIHRTITVGGQDFRIAGIGNVCSHPDARGSGVAKACMQAVQDYISRNGQLDFGVLFTGPPIDGYYAKLGWKAVANQFALTNDKGERIPTDPQGTGVKMIYPGLRSLAQWPDGQVNLNGQDW